MQSFRGPFDRIYGREASGRRRLARNHKEKYAREGNERGRKKYNVALL